MPGGDYKPIDLSGLKTVSIGDRAHKVSIDRLARPVPTGASAAELLESLPSFLAVGELRAVVDGIVAAHRAERPVVFALGAAVVKVGCSPIVIDLIERRVVTAIACHGATAIHDVELATTGATSEDVAANIHTGRYGMVAETADLLAEAAERGAVDKTGLGRALGSVLCRRQPKHLEVSILAAAHRAGIPATVHVAVGTDTVHMHPSADGARIGEATMIDFRIACSVVRDLGARKPGGPGGVWCNIGSAVVLPEVFLKAVAVARNLGADLDAMTTADFDMIEHYRPRQNVVLRPVKDRHGHEIRGHHEILLPLLRQAIVEQL